MDIVKHNKKAWNKQVLLGCPWTKPVSSEIIKKARNNIWEIKLTPVKPIPKTWLSNVKEKKILCLASGGGQQGPILAAAGAIVTVLDNSPEQLNQDKLVAKREGLNIETLEGDMRDLSSFSNEEFDYVINAISNHCIDNIQPLWEESYRVLKKNGHLIAAFNNPIVYSFDRKLLEKRICQLKYSIPYSDLNNLSKEEYNEFIKTTEVLEFGHSLEQQIGGQIQAGFSIVGFMEDYWHKDPDYGDLINKYFPQFIMTLARTHP